MTRDTFKAKGVPECCCTQADAWRSAFIEERAARYRGEGMKIEQARIHAETDSVAALAPKPPAEAQPVAWIAQCELDSMKDAARGILKAYGLVWSAPTGQAGVPLYPHPPPSAPVGVEGAKAYCKECNAAGMDNCAHFDECGGARCITCHQQLNQQPAAVEAVEEVLQRWLDWCNEHNEEPEARSGARIAIEALAAQQAEQCPDCKGVGRGGRNTTDGGAEDDCSSCSGEGRAGRQPAAVDEAMERAAEEIERYEHTFISTVGASAIIRKHMRAAKQGGA